MNKLFIRIFLLLLVLLSFKSYPCSPIYWQPVIIPPLKADGEFTYIEPPTPEEQIIEEIEKIKDLAVVIVGIDWQRGRKYHGYAITQVEILFGWGFQKQRIVQFPRIGSSCGDPAALEEGAWYIAFMRNGIPTYLLPYNEYKHALESRGKPEYVYTSIGLIK